MANLSYSVENVGPISGPFDLGLTGPGLYLLRGGKGVGKSTLLLSMMMLQGAKTALTVHDDEQDGVIKGFGLEVPVGSRKKRLGELEANAFASDRYDLSDLVRPRGETAKVRDSVRINALAALSGIELKPEAFYEVCGGQEKYEELGIEAEPDPVKYANRVSRALHAQAKVHETRKATEEGHVKGLLEPYQDIEIDDSVDVDELANDLANAKARAKDLGDRHARYSQEQAARSELSDAIKSMENEQGEDVDQLRTHLESLEVDVKNGDDEIERIEQQIKDLESQKAELARATMGVRQQVSEVSAGLARAERRGRELESLKKQFKSLNAEPVTESQIEKATQLATVANEALQDGVLMNRAADAKEQSDKHKDAAIAEGRAAEAFRAKAHSVFDVVTKSLDMKEIRVKNVSGNPRLVVDHETRGKDIFFDADDGLSDGERAMVALQELLPRLRSPGILPIPQQTFQDIQPADREWLAQYATENGVHIFGAQITDGPLEVYKMEVAT